MKKISLALYSGLVFYFLPLMTKAAENIFWRDGLVSWLLGGCGSTVRNPDGSIDKVKTIENLCNIQDAANGIIRFINLLLAFAGLFAVVQVIFSGYLLVTASLTGNEEHFVNGKKTFVNTLIGLLIIMFSYIIVNAIMSLFGLTRDNCTWTEPFAPCGS